MDVINIIPSLRRLMGKRKIAMNVTNIDNELAVSIIKNRKIKRFKNRNVAVVLSEVEFYLGV